MPETRKSMSMFSFENKLYIFGGVRMYGYGGGEYTLKDFYEINVKKHCWKELSKNR